MSWKYCYWKTYFSDPLQYIYHNQNGMHTSITIMQTTDCDVFVPFIIAFSVWEILQEFPFNFAITCNWMNTILFILKHKINSRIRMMVIIHFYCKMSRLYKLLPFILPFNHSQKTKTINISLFVLIVWTLMNNFFRYLLALFM